MAYRHIEDILDELIKDLRRDAELREKKQEAINEAIEDILESFDFEKVHKVMKFIDWQWAILANGKYIFRVPTVLELKERAKELLMDSTENKRSISSGGFEVILKEENFLTFDNDSSKYQCNVVLRFVLEETV